VSAALVLLELEAAGVCVEADGEDIKLTATTGVLTPPLLAQAVAGKADLLKLLASRNISTHKNPNDSAVPHDSHDPHTKQIPGQDGSTDAPECPGEKFSPCGTCESCGTGESHSFSENIPCVTPTITPVIIDFETRSTARLDQVGGRIYAAHPQTQVLCLVAYMPSGEWLEWTPTSEPPEALFNAVAAGAPIMAHNAHGFDRLVWKQLGWPDAMWIDSMQLARALGLPGKLEMLAESLLDIKKDLEGRQLTRALSKVDRSGHLPLVSPEALTRVIKYCRMDVLILKQAGESRLHEAIPIEPEVRAVDAAINDRGFRFDTKLAEAVISCTDILAEDARKEARVDSSLLSSPARLKQTLRDAGIDVPDVRRETLLALTDDPNLPDDMRLLVVARAANSGITAHKLRAALRRVSPDGRLRDTLGFHQAHTGRWAGRGFQPQNLPRGAKFKDLSLLEDAVQAALRHDVARLREVAGQVKATVHDVIAALVRACVCAPPGLQLGVIDYSSIEARALLWLAGDEDGLERFRRGEDPYKIMASQLFGVAIDDVTELQRALGKALVLGCGYQMGWLRFELYATNYDVDWAVVGVTPQQAVEAWRTAHPSVAGYPEQAYGRTRRRGGLWEKMEQGAQSAAFGDPAVVGRVRWERRGEDVVCVLPSGRPLVYRKMTVQMYANDSGKMQRVLTFELGGHRVTTYGGKLVENVTQATCRDLLANTLVQFERVGIPSVLHVHDEVVAEIEEAARLEQMKEIMCTAPGWASGLPLSVSGYVANRYRK
jgi:DNA polymerase